MNDSRPGFKAALSPTDLMDVLGISRPTAFRILASGELPYFKVGRLTRIKHEDFEAYIELQKAKRNRNRKITDAKAVATV